ncbi:MAG: nucleoside recognition domain-containing protein [Archaeoglobaceae archaeon]
MDEITQLVITKLLYLLYNILPVLIVAIIGANILAELGLIQRVVFLVRPLIRFARLPDEAGISLITYIASASGGAAMLASFHERKILDSKQTIIGSILSNFFSFLNHAIIFFIPVAIPILGLTAGLLYVGSRFFISICVTVVAALAGHFMLHAGDSESGGAQREKERDERTLEQKVKDGVKASMKVLRRIIPRLVIVYVLVAIALGLNLFEPLKSIDFAGIPGEASVIIAVGFADTVSGLATAGSLLSEGTIAPIQAVIALLLASLVSLSLVFFRHSLPGKIAYFGPKLGLKIAALTTLLDVIFTAIVVLVLLSVKII